MDRGHRALSATIGVLVVGASLTMLAGSGGAAFPGDNGAIAYVCGTHICVGNVDGSNQRQLTTGEGFQDDRPAWSRDGTKIAFERRGGDQSADLYVMNANGNQLTQLTNTPGISESGPGWHPDGTRIVYSRDSSSTVQLYVLTLSTLASQPVPGTPDGFSPAWKPDGSQIAFSSYAQDDQNCEQGPCVATAEIFVVSSSGGDPENVSEHNEAHDLFPSWSPNENKVVFERRPHPNDALGSVLVVETTGEHDFLQVGDGNDPAFAPNGQAIAYDLNGFIHTSATPTTDEVEPVNNQTPLSGLHPDWQPCPVQGQCPSTAATPQTESTTTVTAKRVKTKIKATGSVTPPHPGAAVTVTLFKQKNGVFGAVKTTNRTLTSASKFSAAFKRPGKGKCMVKARFNGDDDHLASEASKTLKC